MNDMQMKHLILVLKHIYYGKVECDVEDFAGFVKVADFLKITAELKLFYGDQAITSTFLNLDQMPLSESE